MREKGREGNNGGPAVFYVLLVTLFVQTPHLPTPAIGRGIDLQIFRLIVFAVFGRSTVITSTLFIQLVRERL